MTVRIRRVVEVPVPPERVWSFIADPENRARAVSVVADYDLDAEDATAATWHVELPLPLLDRTVQVATEDIERRPPEYVKFVGRSTVFRVTGEHDIETVDGGSRLANRFVVEGRLPGVERFFERNLDSELENLADALRASIDADTAVDPDSD